LNAIETSSKLGPAGLEQNFQKLPQPIENKATYGDHGKNEKSPRVQDWVHVNELPSELQAIIERWGTLPKHIKSAIAALIKTAL